MGLALTGIARAGSATNSGPGTLHYIAQTTLTNKHSITNGGFGSVKVDYYNNGKSVAQKIDLSLTNLSSLRLYSLLATLGDDPTLYEVGTFTSDKKGKAKISCQDIVYFNGTAGPTNKPLPALLNPLINVRRLAINKDVTNLLAQVSLDSTVLYAYQVKRNLTRVDPFGTAAGSIDLKGTGLGGNLKLKADGLLPFSMYYLALGTNMVNTALSDKKGRLQMIGWPVGVVAGPSLGTLQLLDISSNAVLTTTLSQ